jgi:hypothetical protein
MMRSNLDHKCEQHPDPYDCADAVVVGPPRSSWGLPVHDGSHSHITIKFCPWCGTKVGEGTHTTSGLGHDWKRGPELSDLVGALKPFGVFVYEDPSSEGTDWFGYILSNQEMAQAEREKWADEDEWDEDEDEA